MESGVSDHQIISSLDPLRRTSPERRPARTTGTSPQAPPAALRVLHVLPGKASGSSMPFARREAMELERAGVVTKLFFLESRTSLIGLVTEWRRLRHEIREFQPNLVHAQFGTVTAFVAAYGSRCPVVVTFRGSDLNPDPCVTRVRSVFAHWLSQLAALKAAGVVCQSSKLRSRLWWKKRHATVLPGSVDLERFAPTSQREARSALNWLKEERVVLFNMGRFSKVKRPDLAQRSVAEAQKIMGGIRLATLDGNVAPDQVPVYLNAADCLLVTSDWEGSPAIVREAMACGLPIVSVDVGDVAERLCDVTESRITSRDPRDLGAALAKILLARTRSNGREHACEFSVDRFNQQLVSVYERALAAGGRPDGKS